ncbi:MAG: DUF3084 domain-containing protein, partial [Candidatus Caldatribacteriota bacterium]|nr:DUF3084 domain-containing protein [Candidatus Caldatribacteriota bacterium]
MSSFILIFFLIIISGLIAVAGDRVGLRIGKKRLTIFGLRPRYTAIFISILTGILITSITILILSVASIDVRTALFGMEELKEKLSNLSHEVQIQNIQLSSTKKDLETRTLQLQETEDKYQKLSKDIEEKTNQLETLSIAKENLTKEKESLDKEVKELNADIKALYSGISWVREGKVIFGPDEQIGLTIVQGGGVIEEIRAELIKFLNEVSEKALSMGAKKNERTNQVFIISQQEFEDMVQKIHDSDKEMIVRLLSSINVIEEEPIVAHFNLLENKLVFAIDEKILSEELADQEDTKEEIEKQLFSLLRKVNILAVEGGIIPNPKSSFVGTISAINFYQTIRKIVESETPMKVSVISLNDTWSVGPLKVKMEVESISSPNSSSS